MSRIVLALTALVVVSGPALAAEFFIVRDPATKQCRIVESRPTDKTVVVVGDKAFVTREEADRQLKVVCKD